MLHYHPTFGAQSFDRTRDVGLLIVQTSPTDLWKIGLDKGQMATQVDLALAHAALIGHTPGSGGWVLGIVFSGMSNADRGYKIFKWPRRPD